ncbi:hypothetical protein PFISCL1PPCAC_19329, partial [Pristionchus fissidentatus]
ICLVSMFDEDSMYDGKSVVASVYEESRQLNASPPQSVIEEYDAESVIEDELEEHINVPPMPYYQQGGGGQRTSRDVLRNLSVVHEGDEEKTMEMIDMEDETQRSEMDSEQFVGGADAENLINEMEMERRQKHLFIHNDPRFDHSFHPKENSWEPSPNQSRVEQHAHSRRKRGENQTILHPLETSKNNKSLTTKTVQFSDKNDTHTLPSLTESSSSSTLVASDERLRGFRSPTKQIQGNGVTPPLPSSSSVPPHPSLPVPCSPAESGTGMVSTPKDRLSKTQIRKSLRDAFSDISAVMPSGSVCGSADLMLAPAVMLRTPPGTVVAPGFGPRIQALAVAAPTSESSISIDGVINAVKATKSKETSDLMRSLDVARTRPRRVQRADFGGNSSTSTTSSAASAPDDRTSSSSLSRQSSLLVAPLSSSISSSSDTSSRPTSTTFIKENSMMTSSSRDKTMTMEPTGLPPRPPLRPTQTTVDQRKMIDLDASTYSTLTTRSTQHGSERSGSRAESVVTTASEKSSLDARDLQSKQRELDFGYTSVGDSRVMMFRGSNGHSFPISYHFSFKKEDTRAEEGREPHFKILDGNQITVDGGESFQVRVQFRPSEVASFNNRLIIRVSGGGRSSQFGVSLFGVGGITNIIPVNRTGLFACRSSSDFTIHAMGGLVSLGVENNGTRSGYVRAVVVDRYGNKINGVEFTPSDSLIVPAKSHKPMKVDMTKADLMNGGRSSSSLGNSHGMGSRRSSTSSLTSIGSSASSDGMRSVAYTIVLYWGEDTQRQRMVGACNALSHSSFPPLCPINEDFNARFPCDVFVPPKDRPLKKRDIDMFIAAMRTTRIGIAVQGRSSFVPMEELVDGDKTLMPDDTFRGGNDSIVSVANDMTMIKR